MNTTDRLIHNYERFVKLPWQAGLAGPQRVWFAVYPPTEERRVRAKLQQFELDTHAAGHRWQVVDLTHAFGQWLGGHEYRDAYLEDPAALSSVEDDFRDHVVARLREECSRAEADANTVVAVVGIGSIFGFASVSDVVGKVEASIRGRLLIFFPGEHRSQRYRFMDARDGFNYMAVPITCAAEVFAA